MTDAQLEWLHIALVAGYEGFTAKSNAALRGLEEMGLVERNPYSYPSSQRWRVERKAMDEWEPGK